MVIKRRGNQVNMHMTGKTSKAVNEQYFFDNEDGESRQSVYREMTQESCILNDSVVLRIHSTH